MSRRLERNTKFLHFVLDKAIKEKQVKRLVTILCDDQIFVLCEILHNIIHGVIPIKPAEVRILKKHKAAIRKILNKKTKVAQKKALIRRHLTTILKVLRKAKDYII